eukprot:1333322-Amorphochlora_amoeboformis.AAC.1
MGKRKSKGKVVKKAKRKTATIFDCPFCNHRSTVECHFDSKARLATIRCRICAAHYQMQTNALTKPIDVYCEWIDKTEEENAKADEYDLGAEEVPTAEKKMKEQIKDNDDDGLLAGEYGEEDDV